MASSDPESQLRNTFDYCNNSMWDGLVLSKQMLSSMGFKQVHGQGMKQFPVLPITRLFNRFTQNYHEPDQAPIYRRFFGQFTTLSCIRWNGDSMAITQQGQQEGAVKEYNPNKNELALSNPSNEELCLKDSGQKRGINPPLLSYLNSQKIILLENHF